MARTIIILIFTIIVLPVVAFYIDPHPLRQEQIQMLKTSFTIMALVALICFAVSEIVKNYSQVDKLWSIMPVVYAWYFATKANFDPRLLLMACCVTLWGVRLTYNFARRGAYRLRFWEGEEDYRWGVLRRHPLFDGKPWRWTLFNFFFISFYQNTLILLITLPMVTAYSGKPLHTADYMIAGIYIIFLILETIADQQQWNFQTAKQAFLRRGEQPQGEYAVGFLRTGLWKYVRHPNYASEQAIWITFYFFSVSATGVWLQWSIAGALLLLILFQGSSDFSESISASKYPLYNDYIQKTGRFIPKLFR
ncbi:MAG: DUF1295 domain-containing protein [Chitinophagales bacterium]|nr:DUF1295 domain-containing protein [Chitinophagales bacterium]MDW8419957.1 DUF1295 domain-containing protein [Chitinophagales bacterium]